MRAVGASVEQTLLCRSWKVKLRAAILVTSEAPPLEFCGLVFPPTLTRRHRHVVPSRPDTQLILSRSPYRGCHSSERQAGEETCSCKAAEWQTQKRATTSGLILQAPLPAPHSLGIWCPKEHAGTLTVMQQQCPLAPSRPWTWWELCPGSREAGRCVNVATGWGLCLPVL